MEQIAVSFMNAGVPATGLSPIVNIWEKNGAKRITNGALQEIAGGFYVYNFNEYSPDKFYLYLFDGTASLADSDRYIAGNNELDAYSNKVTRGRTVAATVDYRPDFKKIQEGFKAIQSTPPPKIDISGINKELTYIKKYLATEKGSKDTKMSLQTLESNLTNQLNAAKEELRTHTATLSDNSNMTIKEIADQIMGQYQQGSSSHLDTLSGLGTELKGKLDMLPNKDELSATADKIHGSIQDVISAMVTNYVKDNFMNMFDLSVKRKGQETHVNTPEEDILAQLTK